MFEWLTESHYLLMVMQIVVTLIIIPIASYSKLADIAVNFGLRRFPEAKEDVKQYLKSARKRYWSVVLFTLLLTGAMVAHAIFKQTELLNWDDQVGLMIMYLLAMLPVVVMILMHKHLFSVLKKHAGTKRSASLKVRHWQHYISEPLLVVVGIANLTFIATVIYFANNPFDGFAGYINLLGLVVIDGIFIGIIAAVYRGGENQGYFHPDIREAVKKKAIQINMIILAIAVFQLSLSMWVQGTDLAQYKLFIQSIYLQFVLAVSAFALTIPKSIFTENMDETPC